MNAFASNLIATFGGSTAVARLTNAPVSTVHSWKHNGIPSSRLAHLRLIAEKEAIEVDWVTGRPANADEPTPSVDRENGAEWPIQSANNGAEIIGAVDRDVEGGRGHPFDAASGRPSCSTSSATHEQLPPPPASPACSTAGQADAA